MTHKETRAKKEYLKFNGIKCLNPNCQSEDIESIYGNGPGGDHAGYFTLDVICNNCGSTWTDIYPLNDVKNINIKNDRG